MNSNMPSVQEQRTRIGSSMKQLISGECYMLARVWWETWVAYTGESGPRPGPIDNTPLVYYCLSHA